MICKNCGRKIDENKPFCKYCGYKQLESDKRSKYKIDEQIVEPNKKDNTNKGTALKAGKDIDVKTADRNKRNSKTLKILIPIIIIFLAICIFVGVKMYKSQGSQEILGEWVLMSGNNSESGFVADMTFIDDKNVSVSGVSGEYTLQEDKSNIIINLENGTTLTYDYFHVNNILKIKMPDVDKSDIGIYIDLADSSEEEIQEYYFAINSYDEIDPKDYIIGYWGESQDSSTFLFYASSEWDGCHVKIGDWKLSGSVNFTESDILDITDNFLIKVGEENAVRVIPLADDKAWFLFLGYGPNSLYQTEYKWERQL